jgi:quercetin dioxygenase-like cupin family protein
MKKLGFNRLVLLGALVLALTVGLALATQSVGITQVIVANALYEGINVAARIPPNGVDTGWKATLKVTGSSDIFVNSNTAAPGANGGWHSHPGLSIVSVTQGAVSNYAAEDPNCTPTIITAGHGFVEPGNHIHLLRNEGTVDAKWTTTAIRPAGSAARIDQPAPSGNCPF